MNASSRTAKRRCTWWAAPFSISPMTQFVLHLKQRSQEPFWFKENWIVPEPFHRIATSQLPPWGAGSLNGTLHMKCFESLGRKGPRESRVLLLDMERSTPECGAHTRRSYNQTDIEVYSASNTAFQSTELKMEAWGNSSWVKSWADAICWVDSRGLESRKASLCHPNGGSSELGAGGDMRSTCHRPAL